VLLWGRALQCPIWTVRRNRGPVAGHPFAAGVGGME
jgi:hypothetical protein